MKANMKISEAKDKLSSSGLSEAEGEELGMSVVTASTLHKSFHPIKALHLPYYDLRGKDSGFYRIRYLELPPGFAGSLAKPQRYAQEPQTLNWAYLPKLSNLNWDVIASDSTVPICITEGELKAACACVNDCLTIGLGGVSVWQSSKNNVPLVPPLDQFNWKGRQVTIIFDSDAADNPNVANAQISLALMLTKLGSKPSIATLPPNKLGGKQGLDDFVIAGGSLQEVIVEAGSVRLAQELSNLNERFAYVKDQDLVIELSTSHRIKRDGFMNGLLANNKVVDYRPQSNGNRKRVETLVPREWLSWTCRNDVACLTYLPGQPQITTKQEYNLWKGWGVEPRPGTIEPWAELLGFLFDGSEKEKIWFEKWCAYPLQNPGAKMYAAAVLWGPETGTGKSLIGYTLGRIYGSNFAEIGNRELHADFNEWAVGKQFILGDEITGSERRAEADKLKALITQQKLRVNAKHLPTYEVTDCLNYYFTSNHPDAFFIDDQDRRYFIHRVPHERKERSFYQKYMMWLNNGGAEFLFHHLLALPIADFDPGATAPVTASKMEMTDHARSDISEFVTNLRRNMDTELIRLRELFHLKEAPDLVLNRHLRHLYDPDGAARVTANGLGRELSRAGFKTIPPIKTKTFGAQRFYVLRNYGKWVGAKPEELKEYIDEVFTPKGAKK